KGVNPRRPREFYAYHAGRNLCGVFTVTGTETERVEFRLQPACTLTGLLVARDGEPLAGHKILAQRLFSLPGEMGVRGKEYPMPENAVTDAEGRFSHSGLFPGFKHYLQSLAPRTSSGVGITGHLEPLKPGETRDLGTLKLSRE